ncbi:LemA family protein [Weissella confusa]|uniref:LemA family protein n=1 Tax=Weissella confusa TaxID=1583 RepID=A0A923NFK6_WEICO|nr:LemA family protein [Weissella confusa]
MDELTNTENKIAYSRQLFNTVVVIGLIWISIYNGLVKARMHTQEAWSQIDVQLKRRNDLIPNLLETVKGYAKFEQGTLEKVVSLRKEPSTPNA